MTWSDFKAIVDELLSVERNRLGAQQQIDRQIRIGLGDVQRLIPYYRKGFVTTYEFDDLERDGFCSRGKLPDGASFREFWHIKAGNPNARKPSSEIDFSARHEMRAGVITFNGTFRHAIDHRGGAVDFWIYPTVTMGYQFSVIWDAVIGRNTPEYKETDQVPFDEPLAHLVYQWVKAFLSMEVDRNPNLRNEWMKGYTIGVQRLYMEVQERLRQKTANSTSGSCVPAACDAGCSDPNVQVVETPSCSGLSTTVLTDGYGCPVITPPQTEWVMFGDSGQLETIEDTVAVANAVKARDPQFIVHLGDCAYGTSYRPSDYGLNTTVESKTGGHQSIIDDLFLRHYSSFIENGNLYLAFGNHDLETSYGSPLIDALANVRVAIGDRRPLNQLCYEFARGPVRFFVLNSGIAEDDANLQLTEQRAWLEAAIAVAAEPWLVVVFHRPAQTSDANYSPGSAAMRSLTNDLRALGVDLVVNGHGHNYERIMDSTGLMHVICGLGGAPTRGAATSNLPTGSQAFYWDSNGFLSFSADETTLKWALVDAGGVVVDSVTLRKG